MSAEAEASRNIAFHVPVVGDALGNSPAYDEWKGDFAKAREMAEDAVRRTAGGDGVERADALIASGLVQLLQGEIVAARSTLQQAAAVNADAGRQLLAFAYENLAAMQQYRLSPAGGLLSPELEARWSGTEFAGAQEQRWGRLIADVYDDAAAIQGAVVYHVLGMETVHRQMLDSPHATVAPQQMDGFLRMLAKAPIQVRQIAAAKGASPAVIGLLESVVADYSARAGKTELARGIFQQASQRYEQAGDACGFGRCLSAVGDSFAAPSSSPDVWNLRLQEGTTESSALTWRDEAREFGRDGIDEDRARALYGNAAALFEQSGSRRGLAALQLRYGWLSVLHDDFKSAVEQFAAAAAMAGSCGDRLMQDLAQVSLALARVGVDPRHEDHRPFAEIGAWGKSAGSVGYVAALGRLVSRVARHFVLRMGDYERARAGYRLGRTLYDALGMPFCASQILVDLGELHAAIGDRASAIVHYNDALLAHRGAAAAVPALLGQIERATTDVRLRLYRLYESEADAAGIEQVVAGLGNRLTNLDLTPRNMPAPPTRIDTADEPVPLLGDEAEQYEAVVSNRFLVSTVEMARVTAACYRAVEARDSGRIEEAAALFARAMTDAKSATIAPTDQLQAVVFAHQRDFDAAAAAYSRALVAERAGSGLVEQLVAAMQQSPEGQREAQMQQQRIEERAALFMLRIERYAEARRHFEALEKLAGRDWWSRTETPWEALTSYGEVSEGLGDLERALEWYRSGAVALDERRRLLSAEELKIAAANRRGSRFLYFYGARAALKLKQRADADGNREAAARAAATAFTFVELGRARALVDLMAMSASDSAPALAARQIRARLGAWSRTLAHVLEEPDPDTAEQKRLRSQIDRDAGELRAIEAQLAGSQQSRPSETVLELATVQSLLDGDTCVLEYAYAGDELLILAIDRTGLAASALVPVRSTTLETQVKDLLDACRSCRPTEIPANDLSARLIEPVASVLAGHTRLLIVPHGALYRVPFHVLMAGGTALLQSHLTSYLPSASVLRYMAGSSRAAGTMLAVGNPVNMSFASAPGMPQIAAPELPGAEIEVAAVASRFDRPLVLCGAAASKTAVVDAVPGYRHLHFATHGQLDPEIPQLSGLLLANGAILKVYELAGIRLDADLVVLSACDTAGGEITRGNDLIGLSHAFLAAGARALVVSLWPVDDRSATVTMGRFYEALGHGDSPADALAAAQRAVRAMTDADVEREYALAAMRPPLPGRESLSSTVRSQSGAVVPACPPAHPVHWAPFVLIGKTW
jgi:CHAT domain-containing protein